jgi:peptidoglycan/LPS O-acetylase OafA/YrhL
VNLNKTLSPASAYHLDIEGMRALAVCLVIAAHLRLPHFAGGFIGVDVFFIISGYLISSILLRDLGEGRFSLITFYERRVRRIVPALFVVLLVTSIVAWFFLLPTDLLDFGRSMVSAMLSVSNIYFSNQSGYFDLSAERRPLLHTWSLGVEEQFYIVFPLLLALLFRYLRAWVSEVVAVLAFISFAACAVLVYGYPTESFYLAPARAWEFLIGTMLARKMVTLPNKKIVREAAGAFGVLLILAATFLFHSGKHFPGSRALAPCCGAALVILSGEEKDSWTYRLLSMRPFVFVGAISYSLYLWHWPLISLRAYNFREHFLHSTYAVDAFIVAETFVLGTLSWRFIERPFRKGFGISRRSVFASAAFVATAVVAFGTYIVLSIGAPLRYRPESVKVASFEEVGGDKIAYRENHCFILPKLGSTFSREFDQQMCMPDNETKQTYLIVGNSHAAHLWFGLSHVFTDKNWQQVTAVDCLPGNDESAESASCKEMRDFLFDKYLPSHRVDAILLSTNWDTVNSRAIGPLLDRFAKFPVKVFVVGPIMRYDRPLPELLVENLERVGANDLSLSSHLDRTAFAADKLLRDVVHAHPGVAYISLTDLLCPRQACVTYATDGVPLQTDDSHLTRQGSILLAQKIKQAGLLGDDNSHAARSGPR